MQAAVRIRAACGALVAAAALALASLTFAAPAANASQISQAYYLFYRHIYSIHANCTGNTHFIKSAGIVGLSPYDVWDSPEYKSITNGAIKSIYYHQNAFSTAFQQEWCRNHDYVYEYFGKNKVQRVWRQDWYCNGGGCEPITNYLYPYKNWDW